MKIKKIWNSNVLILVIFLFLSCFGLDHLQNETLINDSIINKEVQENTVNSSNETAPNSIKESTIKEININNKTNINSEQEKLILNYYQGFFENLSQLKEADITQYFDSKDPGAVASGIFDQTYYNLKLSERHNSFTDLKMKDYSINLDIVDFYPISDNEVNITIEENQDIVYEGTKDTHSYSDSIINEFQLRKVNNEWVFNC